MSEIKYKDLILPSNKKFGRFFSAIFILIAIYFYYLELNSYAFIFLGISVIFIFISFFKSNLLFPLNIAWMRLGNILGRIISPIILGLIFFILFTPISMFTYFFGRRYKWFKWSGNNWYSQRSVCDRVTRQGKCNYN